MAKNIWLIDDDKEVCRSLSNLLSKMGYTTIVSNDSGDAINKVKGPINYDLILCDVRLPGINGVELVEKIKQKTKDNNEAEIPIIFITGYADTDLYMEARKLGKVILKPFDNYELLEAIKEFLTYSQLDSEAPALLHDVTLKPSYSIEQPFPKILQDLSPSALSVDVTNKCNLRCKHCFWYTHKSSWDAMTNRDIINLVKITLKKYPTITNITWYGGEPLIDNETRELIEQGLSLRRNNLVISNGYFPLPDWHGKAHFAISIDGTEKIHDELRGFTGLYKKVKENIQNAVNRRVPVAALYCINATNIECIPDFIKEWVDIGLIGMVFTTYVPIRGKDIQLVLSNEQRRKVVDLLLEMKKKYGSFIGNTELMIKLIDAKYSEELAANCPMNLLNKNVKRYSLHLCNNGKIRVPCAFGMGASHLECRSITKVALYAGKILHDKSSLLAMFRMYHTKPYSQEKGVSINLT